MQQLSLWGRIMKKDDIRLWRSVSRKIIDEVEDVVLPLVGKKEAGKVIKIGADGTPTKLIDEIAERQVIEELEDLGRPLTLISEEIGEVKMGYGPSEVFLVVDPLDGTSNALTKIPAYGISIAVADVDSNLGIPTISDVKIGFVKNFATGDLYEAVKDEGAWINGKKLIPSSQKDISGSLIGAFVYGKKIEGIGNLCRMVRKMRILGSVAIELCYVAGGTYDAFLDLRGNLRIVDIAAAKLIVEEAGGVVTNQHGMVLNSKLKVKERTSIIAACNIRLHKEILKVMGAI